MVRSQTKEFIKYLIFSCLFVILAPILTGCSISSTPTEIVFPVNISVDGQQKQVSVSPGSTVQSALDHAKITLSPLDAIDPPTYTVITGPLTAKITRVKEAFDVEENTVPFQTQTVYNESLPAGQRMLIQPGKNGTRQVTYRRVFENDAEVSRTIFKTVNLSDALPEIIMVGVQTPFTPVTIAGRLAYLTSGNAWIMEGTTSERRPIITTGDLDGRVFSLSPNGEWLLFTRKPPKPNAETINTLWVVNVTESSPTPINLKIKNIINYAGWVPGSTLAVTYSTVEPRTTPPGWQANNDLQLVRISSKGTVGRQEVLIEPNSGGIYGWWGTTYDWSPDGNKIAYARPDSVGLVNLDEKKFEPWLDLIPFQTRSDWAWVPGLGWSPDNDILFTVSHIPLQGLASEEASPIFDLTAIRETGKKVINLVSQSGMFSYPVPAPYDIKNNLYIVAYLHAIFPEQSDSSRYRLVVMDRDASNQQTLFPDSGSPGLEPQRVAWGPKPSTENDPVWIAVIYQGNLWVVDALRGNTQQITGDGSIAKIDWK